MLYIIFDTFTNFESNRTAATLNNLVCPCHLAKIRAANLRLNDQKADSF